MDVGRGQVKDGVWVAGEVVEGAGVGPVFRVGDEASGDRVAVHVAELF